MTAATLYDRLGALDGITAITEDVVAAHMRNPAIQARFTPYLETPERLETLKRHVRDFFAAGSGGGVDYAGRSMVEAHRGMNISEAEYMAAVDDIMATLDKHEIGADARREVLEIAYALKEEIMHV
jgi:hemoglobin